MKKKSNFFGSFKTITRYVDDAVEKALYITDSRRNGKSFVWFFAHKPIQARNICVTKPLTIFEKARLPQQRKTATKVKTEFTRSCILRCNLETMFYNQTSWLKNYKKTRILTVYYMR